MLSQREVAGIMKKEIPKLLHARIEELEQALVELAWSIEVAEVKGLVADEAVKALEVLNREIVR